MATDLQARLTPEQIADHIGVTPYSDMRPFVVQAVKYARQKDADRLDALSARIQELEGTINDALGRYQVTHIHAALRSTLGRNAG